MEAEYDSIVSDLHMKWLPDTKQRYCLSAPYF